jgi:hypothetical protein
MERERDRVAAIRAEDPKGWARAIGGVVSPRDPSRRRWTTRERRAMKALLDADPGWLY